MLRYCIRYEQSKSKFLEIIVIINQKRRLKTYNKKPLILVNKLPNCISNEVSTFYFTNMEDIYWHWIFVETKSE